MSIGIPPAERERFFESFVQFDPSATKARRGDRLYLTTLLKQKGYHVREYRSGVDLIDG